MNTKEKLWELNEKIQKLKNLKGHLEVLYAIEKYEENEDLIGTAWFNKEKNEYYFIIDYNPTHIYQCAVLRLKKQPIDKKIINKTASLTQINLTALSFPVIDLSSIFCEVQSMLVSQIIRNEKISVDEFIKQYNSYTTELIKNIPFLCKEKHHKEINEIKQKEES